MKLRELDDEFVITTLSQLLGIASKQQFARKRGRLDQKLEKRIDRYDVSQSLSHGSNVCFKNKRVIQTK